MILGALAGDVIGAPYEGGGMKDYGFPLFSRYSRFTDDSAMTLAVAAGLMDAADGDKPLAYALVDAMRDVGRRHPDAGYGESFMGWLESPERRPDPYRSWGNGAGMRVSPVAWAFEGLDVVELVAAETARVTHNHPEGVLGARAVAACAFMARKGCGDEEIREHVRALGYPMDFTLDDIWFDYSFDISCRGSVPQAIEAFLEADGFEDAVRRAVSLGGDSDTIGAMVAAMAQGRYGVPGEIEAEVRRRLPGDLLDINDRFCERFGIK